MYFLDEPTTGLHFHDVKKLLEVLHELVNTGNTVVVIEHNLEVIKTADWIVDLGPEGGDGGGEIVASGTPEEVAKVARSYTGAVPEAAAEGPRAGEGRAGEEAEGGGVGIQRARYMGQILERVKSLAEAGEIRVSRHGFRELAADDIVLDEVILGIPAAVQVEEYAEFAKGPAVLVMAARYPDKADTHCLGNIERSSGAGSSCNRLSSGSQEMVGGFHEAREVMRRKTTELIRVGNYAAEVSVELIVDEGRLVAKLLA